MDPGSADRQSELIALLQGLADEGVKVVSLVDSPAEGRTDRAFTLEFNEVDLVGFRPLGDQEDRNEATSPLSLESFQGRLQGDVKPGAKDWEALRAIEGGALSRTIEELNALLEQDHRHFGYRVATEIARFLHLAHEQASRDPDTSWNALDLAVLSKVLVKLHGTQQELEHVLTGLHHFCVHGKAPTEAADPMQAAPGTAQTPAPRLPRSAAKLERMLRRLRQRGFTSFIE